MRSRGLLLVPLILALVLGASACGSRLAPELVAAAADATSPPAEVLDAPDTPEVTALAASPAAELPAPHAEVGSDPETLDAEPLEPVRATEQHGDTVDQEDRRETRESDFVRIGVEPGCVSIGDAVAATITSAPKVHLSLVVSYADGRPHGQMGFAETGQDGVHVWRWAVGPTVPPGEALVFVMATDTEREEGDYATQPFVVAEAGGC